MEKEGLQDLYDFYIRTLNSGGVHLLTADDLTVEFLVFEDFDIGCVSALYSDNLKMLHDVGFISEKQMEQSILLREQVFKLQEDDLWSMEDFRKSDRWREVMELCDEIRLSFNNKESK